MNPLYPLLLSPVSKEILWGGSRLKGRYHKTAPFEKLAESWELTLRPDAENRIVNGAYSGMTLGEFISACGNAVVTPDYDGDCFPLLIKFIDACDRLSIQVHPDDAYGMEHEGEPGKTEMWYIVEADPGAQLVYGLKPGITAEDFAAAVHTGKISETLRFVDVRPGEVYFIPSGQVHAIGAGILIAEIQQNSNITYRVYDYDRRQADGSLRQLHTDKALDVVKIRTEEEIRALRFARSCGDTDEVAACSYFRVRKIDTAAAGAVLETAGSFLSVLCLDGEGEIRCEGETYSIRRGDSYFIPRGCAACTVTGNVSALISETNA